MRVFLLHLDLVKDTIKSMKVFLTFLILLSLIFVMAFGIGMTMSMERNGQMSICPFMNTPSICGMGVFEHIAKFQTMFVSNISFNITLVLIFFFAILALLFSGTLVEAPPRKVFNQTRYFPNIVNKLTIAFSDGILNPKIY